MRIARDFHPRHTPARIIYATNVKDSYVTYVIVVSPVDELMNFGTRAPTWWHDAELSSFALKANEVETKIRLWETMQGSRFRSIPKEFVAGYCERCGLPLAKHVPHDPPGVPKPSNDSPPAAWSAWLKAALQLYQGALESLTDEEILAMPTGINKRWLKLLKVELEMRETHPRAVMERQSALDMLLEDDED